MGCGNASASSENANSNNDSTPATENSPALSQGVSNTAVNDDTVSSETTIETTEVVSEPEPVQNFTGSLYTLPVGAKGEEWTEEQLDEYLKDCKAYQKFCQPDNLGLFEVDIDGLMDGFGFEYVGTYSGNSSRNYNVYWRQAGNLKMVAAFTTDKQLFVYLDNGANPLRIVLLGTDYNSSNDDKVYFQSQYLHDGTPMGRATVRYLKGVSATLNYLCNSSEIDCGRLPYPAEYSMDILTSGSFNLNKSIDFVSTDITLETHSVYQ
ncbi:hypothetical protein J6D24_02610 [Candidatus Saccharibacteria bacterium]|nr:hypothetical protein [Candidatus Saccharibacteria bacterium]